MAGVSIGTRLYTWLRGEPVGRDGAGNRYYREKGGGRVHADSLRRERRWVVYQGEVEWHAWLHHTTHEVPPAGGPPKRPWQKDHLPNLTGTGAAYRPPGHTLEGGRRDKATGDYEPWTPN
jgi:NADH:ubiquinone oxidoreductase subunit